MPPYKKKYTKKAAAPKKSFAKKAVAKAKTKRLTKFIKRVVQRTEEKKITVYQSGFPFGGTVTNQLFPVTPYGTYMTINQGTGQGDRIGNRIRVVSLIMRFTLFANPYNVTTNPTPTPQNVRIWFFSVKGSNTLLSINPPNFIQSGDSSTSLSGTIIDLNRVINNDLYTYLGHRTYKLGYESFVSTPGGTVGSGYFGNNDYKLNIQGYVNCTKMCPKIIKFNDTDPNPNSTLVQCLIEGVNADGTSMGGAVKPSTINYQFTLQYTDA